jgi:DNA polymerase III subunit tau-like protein
VWPDVLDAVCGDNQLVGAALSDARPVDLRDHELVVAFDHAGAFNRRMVDTAEHRAVVEEALRGLAGRPLRVSYELRDLEPEAAEAAARPPSEDEIVARFVTEFDAQEIVPEPDENKEGEA